MFIRPAAQRVIQMFRRNEETGKETLYKISEAEFRELSAEDRDDVVMYDSRQARRQRVRDERREQVKGQRAWNRKQRIKAFREATVEAQIEVLNSDDPKLAAMRSNLEHAIARHNAGAA